MVTIIIFFLSLFGIVFVFLNKMRHMSAGRPYLKLAFGSDFHLKRKIANAKASVQAMPRRAMHAGAFFAVKHGVTIYEKTKKRVYPKIAHIVDVVKGRDIPTNKGSVSLYLRQIEERRRSS
jgi:hypothetical protein